MVKQVLSNLIRTSKLHDDHDCRSCLNSHAESCHYGMYGFPDIGDHCHKFIHELGKGERNDYEN